MPRTRKRSIAAALLVAVALTGAARTGAAAPLSGPAYTHAAAAYVALNRNDLAAAEREARAARQFAPDNPDAARLLVDVLARRGNKTEAVGVADRAIAQGLRDSGLYAQRGYLHAEAGQHDRAMEDFLVARDMSGTTADRKRELTLAVADQAAALDRPAQVVQVLEPYAADRSYAVAARRGFALFKLERHADAREAFTIAAGSATTPEERRTARKALAQSAAALNDAPAVRTLVAQIAADTASCDADLIYLLLRIGDDREAMDMADGPVCAGRVPAALHVDLGYAAKRLDADSEAAERFGRGLDGYRAGGAALDPMMEFALRREIDTLEREFGAVASVTSLIGRSKKGGDDTTQFITEAFWQPRWFGLQNGTMLQAYARLSDSGPGFGASTASSKALEGAIGIRYKPLADTNLVLAVERHLAFESQAIDDWLLRAGYSGGYGLDINPVATTWTFEQHYAELGYYTRQARRLMSGEARYGVTTKLGGLDTVTGSLYLGGTVSYDSAERLTTSAGIGPGISLRYWFRESPYRAPASSVSLDFGYRMPITESDRVGRLYMQLYLSF